MIKQLGINKQNRIYIIIALIAFILCAMILVFKAPYGYAIYDESFYLATPYRLIQGDSVFKDEWHGSFLSGLILLPIVKIYLSVFNSTDGIILSFRYIYVAAQLLTSLYIYLSLKKDNKYGALFAAIVFSLFSPNYIMALSYNTMGLIFTTLAAIEFKLNIDSNRKIHSFLSGLFFAFAVLCCPLLIFAFAIYFLIAHVISIINNYVRTELVKGFTFFTFGAAVVACVFFLYLLSTVSVRDIYKSLPYVLLDLEHPTIESPVLSYINSILTSSKYAKIWISIFALICILEIADRKSNIRKNIYLLIAIITSGAYLADILITINYFNFIFLPITFLGIAAFIQTFQKNKNFLIFFIISFAYSFCINLTSNQNIFVISMALVPATIAGIICIFDVISEKIQAKNPRILNITIVLCMVLFLIFFISTEVYFKLTKTYMDQDTFTLDTTIEQGVEKGIITSERRNYEYNLYEESTKEIRSIKEGNVLYFAIRPNLYLADSKRNASFSAWLPLLYYNRVCGRLSDYYRINPDKDFDYIYVDKMSLQEDFTFEDIEDALGPFYDVKEDEVGYFAKKLK